MWASAFELARATYVATRRFPADERFGLTSQMRRAAVSVAANIAEGYGRMTQGEYLHHLGIARGSLMEYETHNLLATALGYLSAEDARRLETQLDATSRMLTRLIDRLRAPRPRPHLARDRS